MFVGTRVEGDFPGPRHDGNPTDTINDARAVWAANYGPGNAITRLDVCHVMLGTNDARKGVLYNGPTAAAELGACFSEMVTTFPQLKIYATPPPPIDPAVPIEAANALDFYQRFWQVVAAFNATAAIPIRTYDAFTALTPWSPVNFLDPYHLTPAGNAILIPPSQLALRATLGLP